MPPKFRLGFNESIAPYSKKPDRDGVILDTAKFSRLVDEFYELRRWNRDIGRPTREELEELDLEEIADELDRLGILG